LGLNHKLMKLLLKRPLIIFDLEATGSNIATDRIVEIAMSKYLPDGSKETYEKRINPGIPIPVEVSEIHGIYDIDVIDAPTFVQVADDIKNFIDNADFAGFNSNKFDVPMLVEEFLRNKIPFDMHDRKLVDVQNIFHKKEERTLSAAYKFYCDKEHNNAHSALADTEATAAVFFAQLERYNDLEPDVDKLHEFSQYGQPFLDFAGRIALDEKKQPIFNFGKHKGRLVVEVLKKEPAYYHWMMQGDFPQYTKNVLTKIKADNGL